MIWVIRGQGKGHRVWEDVPAPAAARPVPQASSNVFMGLDQAAALGLRSPVPQAGTSEPGWLERQTTAAAERAAKMPAWLTRTAPQAGEVEEIVSRLRALDLPWRHEAADLLTAQAAEIEFLKGHQEGDAESIAALTGIIADKNAEIAELQKVRDFAIVAHDGQVQDKDCIAGWLAAKDAEIARLHSREPLANVALSEENDALIERIAELMAALRPFAEYYDLLERNNYLVGFDLISRQHGAVLGTASVQARDFQAARAAFAPAGKEVKP